MDIGKLLFTFEGRIGRQNFWIGWLILFAASFVLGWIPGVNLIAGFALIYPRVCIYSKRLHDMGKSGWLQVIPYAVWIIAIIMGFIVSGASLFSAAMMARGNQDDPAAMMAILGSMGGFFLFLGIAALVSVGFWLWVGCAPSDPGANRYGAGPDGQVSEEVF